MIENTYEPVDSHRGNVTFLKTRTITAYFRKAGNYC
jgi:hypothetical protein